MNVSAIHRRSLSRAVKNLPLMMYRGSFMKSRAFACNNNPMTIHLPRIDTVSAHQSNMSSHIRTFYSWSRLNQEKSEGEKEKTEQQKEKEDKKKKDEEDGEEEEGDPNRISARAAAFLLGAVIALSLLDSTAKDLTTQQITFQTFLREYLPNPKFDHLEYDVQANKVYVYMNNDGASHDRFSKSDHSSFEQGSSTDRTNTQTQSGRPTEGAVCYFSTLGVPNFEKKLQEAEIELGIPPSKSTKVIYTKSIDWHGIFGMAVEPLLLISFFMLAGRLMGRGGAGGPMGIFKTTQVSKAVQQKSKITFQDVAGMEEAKQEIFEFVAILKSPEKYRALGAKIPRGAILMGPPGTGKTLLAKAVAGESDVPFFSMSGSDFVEMFVGVGPARVRDLFGKARKSNKGAIIFIDEIDAIGRPRGMNSMYGGGNDERENTLNQLLVEMDGFHENENIVVMASTNVEAEGLDPALLRPGRFDRQIAVDKPDKKEREAIFRVHLKPLKVSDNILNNLGKLAQLTPGMAGADIANVCNEAAIYAAREGKESIDLKDFERAIERVIGGLERRNLPITPEEKQVIAHHEAGHAVTSWFMRFTDPLLKISIVPRGKALGYAQYMPQERYIRTYDHLIDFIAQALGGRVAEKLIFGHWSTGAQDDLQKVTRIAYAAVSSFGMSKEVGPVSFPIPGDPSISVQKPYSEETAEKIDQEVKKIIQDAYSRTETLLKEKREILENVAKYLIEHEVMGVEEFATIVGPRPWKDQEVEEEEEKKQEEAPKQQEEETKSEQS